ncbi:hypothetical protein [Paraconexibacter sp. AEG42_29]
MRKQDARAARRWRRRRGAPLLAAAASLLVAGGAIAAVAAGVLDTGAPVPGTPQGSSITRGQVKPGTALVLPLRVADPDGGPPWGIAVYDTENSLRPGARPASFRCLRTGRVQAGRLGVVGRDGVFGNDGKFHPVADETALGGGCSRIIGGQTLNVSGGGPPVPASGYTGSPGTAIGGCLKHPVLSSASAITKRRLGGRPLCDPAGGRLVRAGLAGPLATRVTLSNDRVRRTMTPGPGGAYLFVLKPGTAGVQPLQLTATYRDGTVCSEPLHMTRRGHNPTLDPNCLPVPGF